MSWKWKLAQSAEIRWWQYYLSDKTPQVYLQNKAAYWRRVIEQAQIIIPEKVSVLDAGCGPAGIFMILDQQRVDAVDPLLEKYAQELDHFQPDAYTHVRFITSRLEDFASETTYDLIFCLNAINHVADIQQALDVLVKSLSPKGTLWLSIDAHRHQSLRFIFQRLPGDILHPHQYTLEEYQNLLTERGLEIVQQLCLKPGRIFDYYLLEAKFVVDKIEFEAVP